MITSDRKSGVLSISSRTASSKINHKHLSRLAIVYVRQSSQQQVLENRESRERQYALAGYASELGWPLDHILIIDEDQGISGKSADNRPGFQRLLSEVSLKHVGLVLGLEFSRLSRSSSDWHHLIDVCGVFGTLLCDEDRIYDPLDSNDRLLLGMKGAMSEFELVTIRNRLTRASWNKAERGELYLSVPIGYVKLPSGEIAFDPDEQARAMVQLIFEKFNCIGSAYGVFQYMHKHNLKMGFHIHKGVRRGELEWRLPTHIRVMNILRHPIYAGAYSYGMRRNNKMHKDVDSLESKSWFLAPEDMGVFIKDKLPAYISWDQFEANQKQIAENRSTHKSKGTPRRGHALLAGLITCGKCQRKMATSYKSDKLPSYACYEFVRNQELGGHCGRMATKSLDELVSQQVLKAIEPAALELSIATTSDIDSERRRLHRQWELRMERSKYECEKAERQYRAVEPENRLVARTLESAWESTLAEMQKVHEDFRRFEQATPKQLTDVEIGTIRELSSSIPKLWTSQSTTPEVRKQKIRNEALPSHLRREERIADVLGSMENCPKHGPRKIIGYDTTESRVYKRPELFVLVTKYPKFACQGNPDCGIASPERPTSLIEGDKYSTSVAAAVIEAKWFHYLPIYRQQDLFASSGWTPGRSMLLNIVKQVAFVVQPFHDHMKSLVQGDIGVGIDDTSCRMLLPKEPPQAIAGDLKNQRLLEKIAEAKKKGEDSLLAKMWVYSGLHLAPYNIFDFRVSRHRDGPNDFFRGSRCKVQGDCFSGNKSVVIKSDGQLEFVACWGHARRKVFEATTYKQEGELLLGMIHSLYDIETRAQDWPWRDRQGVQSEA